MSEWMGRSRTNYFMVRNIHEFEAFVSLFPLRLICQSKMQTPLSPNVGYGFVSVHDGGGWPDYVAFEFPEEDEEHEAFLKMVPEDAIQAIGDTSRVDVCEYKVDLIAAVSSFIHKHEVAIFMSAGGEGEKLVTGEAIAINSKGDYLHLDLNHIYETVQEEWDIEPCRAEY